MLRLFEIVVFVIFYTCTADGDPDLTPEALTVYRNPKFFKNLNYYTKGSYNEKYTKDPQVSENYKYPGETTKPNLPASPGFEINYDNSPEFYHEPRDIFVDTSFKPNRKKGPYTPRYRDKNKPEPVSNANVQKPVKEEDESEKPKEIQRKDEPKKLVSVFNENLDEEFQIYHEPILLARPDFESSGFASTTYNKPYPYNRTSPVLYENWKYYTYPKIHANEHLQSDSKIYSEEPSSDSFEEKSPSFGRYEEDYDGPEDVSNFFESNEFSDSGADTKHIYKKLLKPNKSFLLKFHSKPKFKKLKFKLKKKNLHHSDWFDEYPFDF